MTISEEALAGLAETHRIADRRELAYAVRKAAEIYRDAALHRPEAAGDELDLLAERIDRLEPLLREVGNLMVGMHPEAPDAGRIAEQLAAAEGGDWEDKYGEIWDLAEHLSTELVGRLRQVRSAAAAAHRTRGRGRPEPEDLRQVVGRLADYWVDGLGREFTNLWQGQQPVSRAALFVADVVRLIDPKRVPELPTAMKRVVASRKRHPSDLPKFGDYPLE